MKQKYTLLLLGLLFASALIVGCGGGNGGSGNTPDGNWLVGTWEGLIPSRPEGWGEGDFEGYPISIRVLSNPVKAEINGIEVVSYSGSITFDGVTYNFNPPQGSDPLNNFFIWSYLEPSVTLYVSRPTPLHPLVINLWTDEESQSITSTSLKCDWEIQIPDSQGENVQSDGNSGIPNYHIILNKQ